MNQIVHLFLFMLACLITFGLCTCCYRAFKKTVEQLRAEKRKKQAERISKLMIDQRLSGRMFVNGIGRDVTNVRVGINGVDITQAVADLVECEATPYDALEERYGLPEGTLQGISMQPVDDGTPDEALPSSHLSHEPDAGWIGLDPGSSGGPQTVTEEITIPDQPAFESLSYDPPSSDSYSSDVSTDSSSYDSGCDASGDC